eukprot:m.146338 g.146338  ORF g.146338 m.146338 type:complete len:61 (-) comp16236_c1_seq1:683-865(-)
MPRPPYHGTRRSETDTLARLKTLPPSKLRYSGMDKKFKSQPVKRLISPAKLFSSDKIVYE